MVSPLPLGTLLRQRYLIQAILGQGGFGRTYLAIDQERFEERCVLKEFSVPYQDEALVQKARLLFQREASTLYQVQHPQIPRFWAAFEEGQRLFLVQDFVDGPTYRALMDERKQQGMLFSEAEIIFLLKSLLPVLGYIHERSIIHRDISPENILLKTVTPPARQTAFSETALPVLIDFGAVKEATACMPMASSATRVGKIGYAAPEQLQTGQVYPNSDLYSLAATCLALLTGKEPRSLLDAKTLVWGWEPYTNVTKSLAAILNRMLSVYPGSRYQSAQEVLTDLAALTDASIKRTEIDSFTSEIETLGDPSVPVEATLLNLRSINEQPTTAQTGKEKAFHERKVTPLKSMPSRRAAPTAQGIPKTFLSNRRLKSSQRRLQYGMLASFLMGTIVASFLLWNAWHRSSNSNGVVWISGAEVPVSEAPQIIGVPGSANSAIQAPYGIPGKTSEQNIPGLAEQPQRIEFPPGRISTTLQGDLDKNRSQWYVLKAAQGQVLTVTLNGTSTIMNVMRSNQEAIDAAAAQTRSWTGNLPSDDQYLIQISGSGPYTLDVVVTPLSRPTQERTERVTFARGTNGTTVTGSVAPKQLRRYLLKAKQGQLVLVRTLDGAVTFNVIAPSGERIGSTTADSKDWKGRVSTDGDYVIEVTAFQGMDYAIAFEIF